MILHAPSRWRSIDCISDLHLHAADTYTTKAWRDYLACTNADALFILGDLFEVWVGDDILADSSSFEAQCSQALKQASARLDVFIMHGNRDFLMGDALMDACGATLLSDPTVLVYGSEQWLLSHGDALCLDDHAYMQFRQQVRSQEWQSEFLAKPLSERQAIARSLRTQSEATKHRAEGYADVDTAAALTWLDDQGCQTLLHGHTHKPGQHALAASYRRIVLSDWDLLAPVPRSEVLRLALGTDGAVTTKRLAPEQAGLSAP
ncbi:MAG: UDP-2,3-diacylglucosamine diphosphatase [Rhodoferax sp.]